MMAFIDSHRQEYGVESICNVPPIAPSTYSTHKASERDPGRPPELVKSDHRLKPEIRPVWDDNFQVYGVRKTWRQLNREGIRLARFTVARSMRDLGL